MSLPPGTRFDDYELVEHLADGAGAEIHRAVRHPLGEIVAVKVPFDEVLTDSRRVKRWQREMKLTAGLRHERLVRRIDLDRYKSRPYMVFEYVGGGSLRHWLVRGEGLPVSQVVEWGRDLAEGLDYLHGRGLVHADVKPENLLVTDDLELKLADFGAVTKTGRFPLTPPRQILEIAEGTPEYMSPEQIQGRELDPRSDVYAWGVVMYELLTGTCPFTGESPLAVMEAHLQEDPLRIRSRRPEVPPGLEAVVLTAMRRHPAQRHADMTALIDDLDHFESLDPDTRLLDPEPALELQPLRGRAELWRFVGAVAACYLVLVATILGVVALAR